MLKPVINFPVTTTVVGELVKVNEIVGVAVKVNDGTTFVAVRLGKAVGLEVIVGVIVSVLVIV